MVFRQTASEGRRSVVREFCGYGIPTRLGLRKQRESPGAKFFMNLVLELALFDLSDAEGFLDWSWIDDRRDPSMRASETLARAPPAWRR